MYLAGSSIRKIQYELETCGRLTATGKKHWDCSAISRILRNEFYYGIIVYRKNYVPDYLEQKKIRNYDQVQKVETKGNINQSLLRQSTFEFRRCRTVRKQTT